MYLMLPEDFTLLRSAVSCLFHTPQPDVLCCAEQVLTWLLCSHNENFSFMQRKDDGSTAVSLSNPATIEFEVGCRQNCRVLLLYWDLVQGIYA